MPYQSGAGGAPRDVLESDLAAREFAAAATATPSAFAPELVTSLRESGRAVTVVSSCTARAVNSYLNHTGLGALTGLTTARQPGKPNGYPDEKVRNVAENARTLKLETFSFEDD